MHKGGIVLKESNNDAALDAFVRRTLNIRAMLERLSAAADDHFYTHPDDIDWGNVGDVHQIEQSLKRICNQVFKENDDG